MKGNFKAAGSSDLESVSGYAQINLSPAMPSLVQTSNFTSTISIGPTDPGILTLDCQLDSLPTQDCSNKTLNLTGLNNGSHQLRISGHTASQMNVVVLIQNFTVQLPVAGTIVLSLSPAIPATLAVDTFDSTIVATSSGGLTVQSLTCQLDSQASSNCTNQVVALRNLTNGAHTFKISGVDSNNAAIATKTYSFNVQVPVTGSITLTVSPAPTTVTSSSFDSNVVTTITGGVTVQSLTCQLDSQASYDCSNKVVALRNLTNGAHTFKVSGVDSNNAAIATKSYSFNVAFGTIALTLNPAPTTVTSSSFDSTVVTTITGGITVQSLTCQLDSQASYDCSNKAVALRNLVDGAHTFKISGVDSNNAAIATKTYSFTVQIPVTGSITLSLNPTIPASLSVNSYDSTIVTTITGGLTAQSLTCQLDSQASYDCSNKVVTLRNLSNGAHTFKVSGVDSNGSAIAMITSSFSVQVPTGIGGTGNINVNPSTQYQVMRGFEAHTFARDPSVAFPLMINTVLNNAVNLAGVDRVRLEVRSGSENTVDYYDQYKKGIIDAATWRCYRYATVNDNASPTSANLAGFHFTEIDESIQNNVLPLMQKLNAQGKHLYINLNYVAFTAQLTGAGCPANLRYDHVPAQEYAEFIGVLYDHLKTKWNIVPDDLEVILEPDLASHWTDGIQVAQAIVATAAVLRAKGYNPKFVAPSTTNIATASTWIDQMATVPGAMNDIIEFSYHKYSYYPLASMNAAQQEIAKRVTRHGKTASMLEHWVTGNDYNALHQEIKVATVSTFQLGTLCGDPAAKSPVSVCDDTNVTSPTVTMSKNGKIVSQYYRYMNFGAQRIDAQSNLAVFDPLAFINPNGKYLVVVKATAGGTFTLGKLPVGTYGINYSTGSAFNVSVADQTVTAGSVITATIPAAGAITIYQK